MYKPCALVDLEGNCLLLHVKPIDKCKCPFYRSELRECCYCGQVDLYPLLVQVDGEWKWACRNCPPREGM